MSKQTTDDYEIALVRFRQYKSSNPSATLIQFAVQNRIENLSLLTDLIRLDIELLAERNQLQPASHYFDAFPELRNHRDLVRQVCHQDFRFRFQAGEFADQSEYRSGDSEIDRLYSSDAAVGDGVNSPETTHKPRRTSGRDLTGTQIGNYRIHRRISAGRKADVFKAEDQHLQRWVVLKVSRQISQSVSREARFLAKLKHPNILAIHEEFQWQQQQIIVTPFVESKSVNELIAGWFRDASSSMFAEWNSPKERCRHAVSLILKIASAIRHAHNHSVLHCDIKPSNILLDGDGIPLLMDFDIAINSDSDIGTQGGTLGYMSPEQSNYLVKPSDLTRRRVDHRSDIFSLGVVLFELLTGRLPKEQTEDEWKNILNTTSGTTRSLSQIVIKCLQTTPDHRYQSAGELMTDLQNWLDGKGPAYAADNYVPEKAIRLIKRHPVVVAITAIVTTFFLFSAAQSWLRIQTTESRLARLENQLESPADVDPQAVAQEIVDVKADLSSRHMLDFLFRSTRQHASQRLQMLLWKLARHNDSLLVKHTVVPHGGPLIPEHDNASASIDHAISYLRDDLPPIKRLRRIENHLGEIDQAFELICRSRESSRSNEANQTFLRLAFSNFDHEQLDAIVGLPPQPLVKKLQLHQRLDLNSTNRRSLTSLEWHLLGIRFSIDSDLPTAEKCFLHSIQQSTEAHALPTTQTVKRLANIYLNQSSSELAAKYLRMAAQLSPRDHQVRHRIAQIELENGDSHEALNYLKEAIRLSPETAEYRATLGVVYLRLELPSLALEELEQAIRLGYTPVDAKINRALANFLTGKHALAIEELEGVLQQHPDQKTATDLLRRFKHQLGKFKHQSIE